MSTIKIWYGLSLLLLIYNLNILDEESNYIDYDQREYEDEKLYEISFCFPLKNVLELLSEENRTKIVNNQTVFVPELLSLSSDALNKEFNIQINNSKGYFFNNHSCFVIDEQEFKNASYFKSINYKIYPYSEDAKSMFYQMLYIHEKGNTNFGILTIEKVEIDYKSNKFFRCENDLKMKTDQRVMNYSFFNCFNFCLKNESKKVFYLYEGNEMNFINLSDNQRDINKEQECGDSCNESSCSFDYYNSNSMFNEIENIEISKRIRKFKGYFFIGTIDFYLQFIGLITLFLNISFIQTTLPFIRKGIRAILRTFNLIRFENLWWFKKLNLSSSFLSIGLLCLLSYLICIDFYQDLKNPVSSTYFMWNTDYKPISIVLCIPVQSLILNSFKLNDFNEETILKNYTFKDLEIETNGKIRTVLKDIYLSFESKQKSLNWSLSTKVLFKTGYYTSQSEIDHTGSALNLLERCFRIEFDLVETNFEHLMMLTEVVLLTQNGTISTIYIVEKNQKFLTDSHVFSGDYGLTRMVIENSTYASESNCTNYLKSKLNHSLPSCTSQRHCIEKCINSKFIGSFHSLTTQTVIDKEELSSLVENFDELHFNKTFSNHTNESCERAYLKDCKKDSFLMASTYGRTKIENEFKINLYTLTIFTVQLTVSYEKLAFKFFNVIAIIYGLNVYSLLWSMLTFNRTRYRKICEQFVIIICFFGFIGHTIWILIGIINGKNVYTGYFETSENALIPDLVFCVNIFDITPKDHFLEADHHKFTGNYLNQITSNVTVDNFMNKLTYLDKEIKFNRSKTDEKITLKTFYFNELKCFEIKIRTSYSEKDVYCLEDIYLIKIYLNHNVLPEFFYFIYKEQNSKSFSQITRFSSKNLINRKIKFEVSKQKSSDKFKLLKHPIASFYSWMYGLNEINSTTSYFDKVMKDFNQNYNLTTKLIVLEEQYFDYEINDKMFIQFFSQIQNQKDTLSLTQFFDNLIVYETAFMGQNLVNISDHANQTHNLPDFELFTSFFEFILSIENEDNFIQFLQDFLNAISLWLNLCLLDLYVILNASIAFIAWFYLVLVNFKMHLFLNLQK